MGFFRRAHTPQASGLLQMNAAPNTPTTVGIADQGHGANTQPIAALPQKAALANSLPRRLIARRSRQAMI